MASSERVPLAYLVVDPGGSHERALPVYDQLFIGRECAGVEESRRFVIDDPEVSRNHAELRLDVNEDRAYIVDSSINGTELNGHRIQRAMPMMVRSTDRITVGPVTFEFQSEAFHALVKPDARKTAMRISQAIMIMVVGDIEGYSTIAQYTPGHVLTRDLDVLYGSIRDLLAEQLGMLSDYAGDAVFAVWDCGNLPDATDLALMFTLRAIDVVAQVAPSLTVRDPAGRPVRLGWAVVRGEAAVSSLTGSLVSIVGDAANLAFRLSGLAGRESGAPVIVTDVIHDEVADRYRFGPPKKVDTKGRSGQETIYELLGPI